MKNILLFLLLSAGLVAAPTTPINNVVVQVNGTAQSGVLAGNGAGVAAASATAPQISTALDLIGSTQGSLLYRGSTAWSPLTPGTAGTALISGGAGANPSWSTNPVGDVVGPATSTNNAFARWDTTTGKLLKDTSDLTYSTPTMSTPDLFNVSSAGSIALTAGGSNKNVIVAPSGTGYLSLIYNATEPTFFFSSGIHITAPNATNTGIILDTFGATPSYTSRRAEGTSTSPTAVTANIPIWQANARGYGATAYSSTGRAAYQMLTQETWTDSAQGTRHEFIFTDRGGTTLITNRFGGNSLLELDVGSGGLTRVTAWGTSGPGIRVNSGIYRDTVSTGTVATAAINSLGTPTITTPAGSTTFTDFANFYIAAPPTRGTNVTGGNPWAAWIDSGNFRLDGSLYFNGITGSVITDTSGALSITGGAGSSTYIAGTGNNRTMTFQTTTSGGTATTAMTLGTTQVPTFPQSRKAVTAQFDSSSGTTPANITGLSVALPASGTYSFRAALHITADATGGEKIAAAYSGTSSAIIYQINSIANTTNANVINSRQTASAGAAGAAGDTAYFTTIDGTLTATGAGNITMQFSRNAATGTSSVLIGSSLEVFGF